MLPRVATSPRITLNLFKTSTMSLSGNSSDANQDIENPRKGVKIVPPEGMSKRAYKRQLKSEQREKERPQWLAERKQRRKEQKEQQKLKGVTKISNRKRVPLNQVMTSTSVVLDCDFDDYMKEGERTSLARQIMTCYGDNRKAPYQFDLRVTSFNKLLRDRFVNNMKNTHLTWKNIKFEAEDFEPLPNVVYLSSDSDTVLESLAEDTTYVVGGIVDKGRYKNLCKDKAERLGLRTARLPIDEYIKMSGRRVLTTNHVFELLLRWMEFRDWKRAFEMVLPDRKMKPEGTAKVANEVADEATGEVEPADGESVEARDDTAEEGHSEATDEPPQ